MGTLQQVIYERPPEGLARGRLPVPWWVVLIVAASIVVIAVVFLIVRGVVGWQLSRGPTKPPAP